MCLTNMIMLLIPFLITVESHGDPNAIGRNGELGILQINQGVIDDVNHFCGGNYIHHNAFTPALATEICSLYLLHWGRPSKLKRKVTFQDLARIWNGGPRGYRRSGSLKYWYKVKKEMNKERG